MSPGHNYMTYIINIWYNLGDKVFHTPGLLTISGSNKKLKSLFQINTVPKHYWYTMV